MKLLGSAEKDVVQDKDGENVPKLESIEIVLVHCNLVNTNYQQASFFTFAPNKNIWAINHYCASFIKNVKNN